MHLSGIDMASASGCAGGPSGAVITPSPSVPASIELTTCSSSTPLSDWHDSRSPAQIEAVRRRGKRRKAFLAS
jgi:hypothetical protein